MCEKNCILHKDQYNFIWRMSFLSLFSSFYGIYNKQYDIAFVPFGVFLTSINYWRKPDYSWRRYLDMTYVKLAFSYQLIKAYNSDNFKLYYFLTLLTISFYSLGVYYYRKKMYWKSTYSHSMIHVLGNISNIILYSGCIAPFNNLSYCVK